MTDDDAASRRSPRTSCSCATPACEPVVVHGGGPQISTMLDRLGIESEFRGGLRVTTPEAMDVVRMVLVGQVGRELVGLLNQHGPLGVGLSGEDAGLFTAARTGAVVDGEDVDLGLVGEVVRRTPRGGPRPDRRRPDPGGLEGRARRATARCTTSTPTRRPPRSPSRSAPRSWSSSPTSRGSTATGRRSDDVIGRDRRRRARRDLLPTLASGMVPKMEACLRAVTRGRAARDRRRRPGAARACCSRSSPTTASAPWCCRTHRCGSGEPCTHPRWHDRDDGHRRAD